MKKSFIITSMAAFAALCFSVTAQAQGPVVVSDKDDYHPGEIALFSATGFQPNELLDFSVAISDDNGGWIPDIAWTAVPADAFGGAEVDYVVPQTWLDKTLQLTVMGLTSGLMAQTTFTDHNPDPVLSYSNYSISASGNTVTFSVDVSCISNCTGHTITRVGAFATSNPVGNDLENITLTGPGGSGNGTWSGPATGVCGTIYTFTKTNTRVDSDSQGPHNFNNVAAPGGLTATTDPCPSPTPSATPSGTPSPTPCQNTPPVITCASPAPTPDLGEAVGCLGTGDGFGQTFPIMWECDPVSCFGTSVTVKARFLSPDSSSTLALVDVATVTDPDGVQVSWNSGSNDVTISGPGTGTAPFHLDIDADDGQDCNNTASNTCGGTASADIVYHVHYLPPLYDMATTKVKQGSGVPVKMQLTDCSGTPITPDNIPGDTPTIAVNYLSGTVPSGPADVDDAGNSNGDTLFFRWSTDGPFWIFNLKTNSSYAVGATYEIEPSTVDGTAKISIK